MPLHSYSRAKKCALANNSMYVFISVSSVDSVTNRSYALGCNFSFKIVPQSPHHSENINSFFFQQIELVNFSESNGKKCINNNEVLRREQVSSICFARRPMTSSFREPKCWCCKKEPNPLLISIFFSPKSRFMFM